MVQFIWKQVDPAAPKKPRALTRPNQSMSGTHPDATHHTAVHLATPVHRVVESCEHQHQSGDALIHRTSGLFPSSPERHPLMPSVFEDPVLSSFFPADLYTSADTHDAGGNNATINQDGMISVASGNVVDAVPLQTTMCHEEYDTISAAFSNEQDNINETVTSPELADLHVASDIESAEEPGNQSCPQLSSTQVSQTETTLMADIQSDILFPPAAPPEIYQDAVVLVTAPAAADCPPSPLSLTTQEPKSHVGAGHTLKRSSTSVDETHRRKKRLMREMRPIITQQGDDCWDDEIPELFDRLDTMTNLNRARLLLSILEGFLGSNVGETSLSFNALPRCVRAEIWIRLLVGLGDEDELASESPCVPQWFSTELLKGRSAKEATSKHIREIC